MTTTKEHMTEYRCPGEQPPISRAIHLARLARFFPACRQCAHREESALLAPRLARRLKATWPRAVAEPLFHAEGAAGVLLNSFGPAVARRLAAAMGVYLRRQESEAAEPPEVVLGGDGRALTPQIVAAVGEGLRWSGCRVVDVGQASAACLAFAIAHLDDAGGILVGNPVDRAQGVGLKFWAGGACPLSSGGPLDDVRRVFEAGVDRPTRRFGSLRRFQAEVPYLAGLAEHYHALRPLRFVLHAGGAPVAGYLETLTRSVACRVLPCRVAAHRMAEQIRADGVHFGVRLEDDGERLLLWDERGCPVHSEQLLLLLARRLLADEPGAAVVVEQETASPCIAELSRLGGRVAAHGSRRGEMAQAMREHRAVLGGGPSGRLWYGITSYQEVRTGPISSHLAAPAPDRGSDSLRPVLPMADGLRTLTLLLRILSQSDRSLSQVLDAALPAR